MGVAVGVLAQDGLSERWGQADLAEARDDLAQAGGVGGHIVRGVCLLVGLEVQGGGPDAQAGQAGRACGGGEELQLERGQGPANSY